MTITKIETITQAPGCPQPNLIFVIVHTADGLVGHGETYYAPNTVEAFIHEQSSHLLLGADESRIEYLWRLQFDLACRFGSRGAEIRAISAIDVALWDIAGQRAGVPIYQLLGGTTLEKLPVYNTCGGPSYGSGGPGRANRTPYVRSDSPDPRDDLWFAMYEAGVLAQDLLDDGFTAMKVWPFDPISQRVDGGRLISKSDLREGVRPLEQIRHAVGDGIEIMLEGHGYWQLAPAISIAKAVEEFQLAWLEDLTLARNVSELRRLRESTSTPVSASEFLMTRWDYLPVLEQRACDYIMIDPTWTGGITESKKIATMADGFGLPITMHDCTGPFTLLAGMHLLANAPNGMYQEVVRAFLRYRYSQWVDWLPDVSDGSLNLPERPGIGAVLDPGLGQRSGYTLRSSLFEPKR
ncbi:mandelate racemase/muconate lactonizing enzyme family protein [Ruania alba]|uniref:L-alanine-DL-glutamate epimerase n=1 Tax=Ruania alba TaxID=648782 RepID=A0A1H5M537_9MICO|nr:mandelate racemase/muconate lactonizing enzyme family protein [Ruania alba]SEE83608.1 L-alanine-DL-glutamate epimerase [Ruania alba]